ncbi:carboxylesterase [Talaromyces proteolyticus]|uniref:Carboxylic ester hydrolase n=1 Tax=Talaromyces proteolyticus TaxID=1131652 RepID=A0AAD4KF78_9EURO|nr:carboxylesterase [Talaromyces proteolyticus]KAH8690582.1 carboxylesterase [Talaromyces proteolyticus]
MRVQTIVPFLTALLSTTVSSAFSPNPKISLDYITLAGNYSSEYNITYFRKIPFAAPPLPPTNRFRAPQLPLIHDKNDLYNTDQDLNMCPQRTVNGSEDCLYLGVYSRPWDSGTSARKSNGRPVLVNFYGGAFIEGSASWKIPPPLYPVLNVSDINDFVIVEPNYRLNAFGFLPGKEIKNSRTADLNVGLLDQQFAIEWVKRNIHHFGGNPNNISIWGQSAGAGSVVGQILASSQAGLFLFNKATTSSPFWPKTYQYDDPEAEAIYDQLVSLTGCGQAKDSLVCLKEVDVQTIRNASLIIDSDHTYTTSSYTWAPVIDNEFLKESLTTTIKNRNVNIDFIYGVYNAHEGENFIPPGLQNISTVNEYNSSLASYDTWLRGFLPRFTEAQLGEVNRLYPAVGSAETIATYNTTYERAQLIYRDLVLACPSYWLSSSAKIQGWLSEYAIPPAKHGSDTIYWNQINAVQKTDPLIYEAYAGAFASFFQTGDPNCNKLTTDAIAGVPVMQHSGEEFVVGTELLQQVKLEQLTARCAFWLRNGRSVPI